MLTADHLSHTYGEGDTAHQALADIHFEVYPG